MPVTITDRKEMAVAQVQDVWVGQVSVLVYFVGVVGCDASLGCEGELGHHVVHSVWVQSDAGIGIGSGLCSMV